ncbi:MAG: hypothetical protein V1850_02185 [Candidatus Bathyarchaeota archaeon]
MSKLMYAVDLIKIDGEGDFLCPRCRMNISPEDETEDTYSMLGFHLENSALKEVVIACKKCRSIIHLRGFDEINYYNIDELVTSQ